MAEDELVRTLVDVELLLSLFHDLGILRFRLLNHDHMEPGIQRVTPSLLGPAFQLSRERRF